MIAIGEQLTAQSLRPKITSVFESSAKKIRALRQRWQPESGAPVFTIDGKYTSRGWTEWTQGFQFGSEILQFDATGEAEFLREGVNQTVRYMAPHISHIGVHDHGFNNISTYGNLLRMMNEGVIEDNDWERKFYALAVKLSGAIQGARWTQTGPDEGYIYSFNGPHSLFVDTIRSLRALAVSHQLGHVLMGENDRKISLLDRLLQHAEMTAKYAVYYGEGRDVYDIRGRTAHESIFNTNDGRYRCPNSQQGYSPFSTWTRGLAWAMCGFAEQLEFLAIRPEAVDVTNLLLAAEATCDFYLENTPTDGVPYWDTGAPGLVRMSRWRDEPADPFNPYEPVDSSAAAIAAQGLLRLGRYLDNDRYWAAGLTVANTLFGEPYLSMSEEHEGLLLHSVYHRPNGWDAAGKDGVPRGEACQWGDYHLRELALYLQRVADDKPYLTFWSTSE